MALILFVSSRSSLPVDATPVSWLGQYRDEVGHLGEYSILGLLAYAYLRTHATERLAVFLSLAFCVGFSLGDELLQSFIPNRTAEVKDILLDAVGAAGALFLAAVLLPRLRTYWRRRSLLQENAGAPDSARWRDSQK